MWCSARHLVQSPIARGEVVSNDQRPTRNSPQAAYRDAQSGEFETHDVLLLALDAGGVLGEEWASLSDGCAAIPGTPYAPLGYEVRHFSEPSPTHCAFQPGKGQTGDDQPLQERRQPGIERSDRRHCFAVGPAFADRNIQPFAEHRIGQSNQEA